MKNLEIKQRYEALKSQRKTIEQTWQMINDFMMPFRSEFFSEIRSEHSVEWRENRFIYDSTAVMALQTLASSLHGSLTSPSINWFNIKFREEELNDNMETRVWLEESSKIVYQALQDSNFNVEVNEAYIDLVGYGTAFPVEEFEVIDGRVELRFQTVPVEQAYFEEDFNDQVETFYRLLRLTAVQIVSKFGDNVPDKIKKMVESLESIDSKHDVIFCIFKRKGKPEAGVLAGTERPVGFKYIMAESGDLLGEEGGYYEMPVFAPRWRKATGSKYGYSPAFIALPDVLTLNTLVELILKANGKVVDPAVLVTERGLLSDVDLESGGLTVLRTLDDMKPYESGARFDVSNLAKNDLRESIKSIFYTDQLELRQSANMTATEVQVRYEMMQRLLGPTLGRLQTDFLNPLINRTFKILLREGMLPEMPEILLESGGTTEIDYVGPLSRAQKSDVATSVERWIGNLINMAEAEPEVLDIPNFDGIAKGLADMYAVPASMRSSKEQIATKREERKQQQAQMAQAQQAQMEGDAMKAQGEGQAAISQSEEGPVQ